MSVSVIVPWSNAQLGVPTSVNTIGKKLGYWHRRQKITHDRHSLVLAGTLSLETWFKEHLGVSRELSATMVAAKNTSSVPGPPTWAVNHATQWAGNAVMWPPGLENAPAVARLHFLFALERQLQVAGVREYADLQTKQTEAIDELANDSSWD